MKQQIDAHVTIISQKMHHFFLRKTSLYHWGSKHLLSILRPPHYPGAQDFVLQVFPWQFSAWRICHWIYIYIYLSHKLFQSYYMGYHEKTRKKWDGDIYGDPEVSKDPMTFPAQRGQRGNSRLASLARSLGSTNGAGAAGAAGAAADGTIWCRAGGNSNHFICEISFYVILCILYGVLYECNYVQLCTTRVFSIWTYDILWLAYDHY